MALDKRTILIIGGTSGIGLSVATRAAHAGAQLVITRRNERKLDEAVATLRGTKAEIVGHVVDAADEKDLKAFSRTWEPFDHLVSSALKNSQVILCSGR
jgi:short-subunit dehydrogenase involved in D-alanine esterification of teichoic acids